MENPDRKVDKEEIHPRVPIKTYKWEDVKRSRTKGGYPWTYLYKQPFDEELDPEPYTMEGMRKSKSSSTMGKSEVEISELMDTENHPHAGEHFEKSDDLQIITEPDDHSIKCSSSSLVIEECDPNSKDKQGPGIFFLESAESSDDISQYLDREDRSSVEKRKNHESELDITMEVDEKDDEPQTRKRKLSAESSYSRISQTKSAILKTIRDTKAKIKVPKLSFPTSKLKKPAPKKKSNSPPETKKEIKKTNAPPRNVKPLYIHIPLKPPPGETDEFSHLELGSDQAKKHQQKKPGSFRDLVKNIKQRKDIKSEDIKEETETEESAADVDAEVRAEEEANEEIADTGAEIDAGEKTEDDTKVDDNTIADAKEEAGTIVSTEVEIMAKSNNKVEMDVDMETDNSGDAQNTEELNTELTVNDAKEDIKIKDDTSEEVTDQQLDSKSFGEFDPVSFKAQETPELDPPAKCTESEEEMNNSAQADTTKYDDMFDKLFDASTSKDTETQTQIDRKGRSKSAEPERKRKVSLESSYSRKSLSKLGLMKKLKEASDKIKKTLSRSTFKKEIKPTEEKIEKAPQKSKQLKPAKPIEPVYIHIPLKAPEDEKEELSQLQVDDGFKTPDTDSTTPDSPAQTGVQFIFLTAPSDDETLDYNSSDVPETPSSENKVFFSGKISELKELAKGAVDEIAYPKHKLDPVSEESSSDKVSVEGGNGVQGMKIEELPEDKNITKELEARDSGRACIEEMTSVQEEHTKVESEAMATSRDLDKDNILVDEEDGLSEPKATKTDNLPAEKLANIATPAEPMDIETTTPANKEDITEAQSPELKSSLKGEGSPVLKKKVSFKRRTRASKDGSYEDVQVISSSDGEQKKELKFQPGVLHNTQSISAEGDDEIFMSVPPGEDYNKWSKISDHEYEPVNPPPENIEIIPRVKLAENPTVRVINTDQILNNSQVFNFTEEEAYKRDPAFLQKFQKGSKPVHRPPTVPNSSESPSECQLGEEPYMQDPAFQLKFKRDSKMVHQQPESREGPSKFQQAIKQRADNFRTRLHNIKKPHITLPDRPKFHKPNFQKFSLPKIPDRAKMNLPSFSLPHRHAAKRPTRERHLSTESNDGDSKKPMFDFSTYPRMFKKKPKEQAPVEAEIPSFATVPRTKKPDKPRTDDSRWSAGSDSMRVPLHSEDSTDADYNSKERYIRGDSIEDNEPSHIRYDEDIDSDDEYDRENRELNRDRDFLRRWDQGTYNADDHEYIENMRNKQQRITDLDSPEETPKGRHFRTDIINGDRYSSGSSQGMHRQGVLEEINSDEFFLRQKGISQDNIEVGMYLSSEIREAFRTPVNALSQMQGNNDYELRASNQSLPEMPAKRKSVKKPKRKKTPHTSQEKIPYDEESAEDELGTFPPPRPRRHSRRGNKNKNTDTLIPYQETIPVDTPADRRLTHHRESLGILADDEQDEDVMAYVIEKMEGKGPLDIRIADPYRNFEFVDDEEDNMDESPAAPPRKQKSLKSLNMSESDSIMGDFSSNKAMFNSEKDIHEPEVEAIRAGSKIIIPIQTEVPKRPSRTRSRTNSQSRGTSQKDDESLSLNTESVASENQIPCVEEPCIRDLRDSMGYAIIDKSKARDPPLPPPRIPTRRKRSFRNENDGHFSTVPRPSRNNDTPVRPLRNYSTLGQTRKSSHSNTYENKENIDISQYIEIEDEHNRDLQSGAVIKRMKDRPLPAPPRPPRKSRPFRDITSQENITTKSATDLDKIHTEEAEVSTQTEPLPDDFICEEVLQEETDTIIIPTRDQNKPQVLPDSILEQLVQVRPERKAPRALPEDQLREEVAYSREQEAKATAERKSNQTARVIPKEASKEPTVAIRTAVAQEKPTIERRLITPSVYSYEETITHGSLLVQPIDGAKLLPNSDLSNVKMIPVHVDSDLEETSSIPEEFNKLADAPTETKPARPTESVVKPQEFDILKAHKLQVADLDVDQLTVNKLLADRIIVSEIDSSSIQSNEISSKTGALRVGEITLPAEVISKIIETLRSSQVEETGKSGVQKKTPISGCSDEPSTVKSRSFRNEPQEEEYVGYRDPSKAAKENALENLLPSPGSSRLPEQQSPGELHVQKSPDEFSAQENLPAGSNVHDSPSKGLGVQENPPDGSNVHESPRNELDVQEHPSDGLNVHESPRKELGVQENLPDGLNVLESPHKELGVQENLPDWLTVHESPHKELGVQENAPDGLNVHESPHEDLGVQESLSSDIIIRECPSEYLKMAGSNLEELSVPLHDPEDFNVQTDPSEDSNVLESPVGYSNVHANLSADSNVQEDPSESSIVQENHSGDLKVQENHSGVVSVQENHSDDLNVRENAEEPQVQESPPKPPPRSSDSNTSRRKEASEVPPHRPPRQSEKHRTGSSSNQEESLQEPDVDDVPPPRPPQPQLEYIPSQPPASFYALRAQKYVDSFGESIPAVPRRKRHAKSKQLARSSSEESSVVSPPSRRFHRGSSDASIANLSGQLVRVCGAEVNSSLKRLITYILNNVARNEDGKQDLNVMIMIVVVLIAGLILLGYGDEKTVVHLHHWEYFNPPGST